MQPDLLAGKVWYKFMHLAILMQVGGLVQTSVFMHMPPWVQTGAFPKRPSPRPETGSSQPKQPPSILPTRKEFSAPSPGI